MIAEDNQKEKPSCRRQLTRDPVMLLPVGDVKKCRWLKGTRGSVRLSTAGCDYHVCFSILLVVGGFIQLLL